MAKRNTHQAAALEMLKAEHQHVKQLFQQYERAKNRLAKQAIAAQVCTADEVRGAHVRLRFGEGVDDAVTDAAGYFSVECRPAGPLPEQLWHPVGLELLHPQSAPGTPVRATGQVLVPPRSARFGVISDIDDTIIQSHIGNRLKMVLTVA